MTDFRGQVKNDLNCGKMKKTILIRFQQEQNMYLFENNFLNVKCL